MNFKNLFCSKLNKRPGKFTKKTIKFLGLSISYDAPQMSDVFAEFENKFRHQNANTIFMLYNIFLKNASSDDLFCLRNNEGCFIFNNKVLDFGYKNFRDIILNCYLAKCDALELSNLDKESVLYKEHIVRLNNNEFLWKYRNIGFVQHQFLSYDENGYYVNETIIGDKTTYDVKNNCYFQAKTQKRQFYDGVTLGEYLDNKSYDEQKEILIKLAEHIFATYSVEKGMISGKLYDCYEMNFICGKDGKFYFIDDNYISKNPISKEYVLKRISGRNILLTNDLLTHFGFSPLPLKNKNSAPDKTELMKKQYFS